MPLEVEYNTNSDYRKRVSRLRMWILALLVVIVFAAFFAPLVVIISFQQTANQTQLVVTCQIAQSDIETLEAIERNGIRITQIAQTLGLPVNFPPPIEIPTLPPECEEHT